MFRIQERDEKLKTLEESLQAAQAGSSTKDEMVKVWAFTYHLIKGLLQDDNLLSTTDPLLAHLNLFLPHRL